MSEPSRSKSAPSQARAPFRWQAICQRLMRQYPMRSKRAMVVVSVATQRLYLIWHGRLRAAYAVSTSRFGTGTKLNSLQTPTGAHRVAKKIGAGAPLRSVFKARRKTHKMAGAFDGRARDLVCSRILWLDGLEQGRNRGGARDSLRRYIYIHGTPDERSIGRPASYGCIRMKNKDVCELFDALDEDALVYIADDETVGGKARNKAS